MASFCFSYKARAVKREYETVEYTPVTYRIARERTRSHAHALTCGVDWQVIQMKESADDNYGGCFVRINRDPKSKRSPFIQHAHRAVSCVL